MDKFVKYIGLIACALFPLSGMAQDSVAVRGFWGRYSKTPKMVVPDTAFIQKQQMPDQKTVRFIYDVDFDTYFDNREYRSLYTVPQTIFNFRLSPAVGVRLRDRVDGKHDLVAGVRYTQRLGGNWKDVQLDPTVYYRWRYKGFDLAMGAIPYEHRIRPMQDWLLYDSIAYMHPNIQGALLQYHDHRGYVSAMADWRGAQTTERREMFQVVIDGEFQWKGLMVGGLGHINHTAGKANDASMAPYDDLHLSAHIGFDATRYVPLDSLSIQAAYIYGYERNRKNNVIYQTHGFLLEFYLNWWFLGVKNTFYYGDNMQPFRPMMGSVMYQGDPFYQSKIYDRVDLFIYLYRSSFVDFYFSYNFHFDDQKAFQEQQQLFVRFNLDGLMSRKEVNLRGLFDK